MDIARQTGMVCQVRIKLRVIWIVMGLLLAIPTMHAGEKPDLQVREVKTPWGIVIERVSYTMKDGKEIQQGADEIFSDDGKIQIRSNYANGEPDGLYQIFYDGIGTKQTETNYVNGNETGPSRTWAPDGKLLFEGTWKDGRKWDGWFDYESTSGSGIYHHREESWKIDRWQDGKKVRSSTREVKAAWRDWEAGSLPDVHYYCRWSWSQFTKPQDYPYLTTMPPYREVPYLIERCAGKEPNYEVAWEQLMALTRVSFGDPWLQSDDERKAAAEQWRKWWKDVGQHRPDLRKTRGLHDKAAWEMVRADRDLPLPKLAVVIPETYKLTARFSSGDYDGVTSETVTIERNRDSAELIRRFSTRRDGPVTEERWLPFGPEEADRVVRAIGYLVDQPWLLNDEKEIERRFWAAEKIDPKRQTTGTPTDEKQKGRESYGRPYYPDAGYELRDGDGKLWCNADPDDWSGGNPERFNHSQQAAPGVVFPFLAITYPESVRRKNDGERGWGGKGASSKFQDFQQ